jgi:hypothetical protein
MEYKRNKKNKPPPPPTSTPTPIFDDFADIPF